MAGTDASTHTAVDPGRAPAHCCAPSISSPLSEKAADELAAALKALADPVRLRLVSLIASSATGEACACDLPAATGRSQPTVSHHLSQLVKTGILTREQRGKWAWFRIDSARIDQLCTVLATECCPADPSPADSGAVERVV